MKPIKETLLKRTLFSMLVTTMLVACFPISVDAKKIHFGKQITYNGELDATGKPHGKGKIETSYGNGDPNPLAAKEKDILEGYFENGVVKDAKLLLHRYNGPLWINSSKFTGTLEYTIADDGSSITYKMTEGKFETNNLTKFKIEPSAPFSITRTPQEIGCKLNATNLYMKNETSNLSLEDIDRNYFYPLEISELGNVKRIIGLTSYSLNSEFKEYSNGNAYIVELDNGYLISKAKNGIELTSTNKDSFFASANSNSIYTFHKTFPEGVLSYTSGPYFIFSGADGQKGLIEKDANSNSSSICKKIMCSTTIQATGLVLHQGPIAALIEKAYAEDGQAQYDLAMAYLNGSDIEKNETLANKWMDKAAKNGNAEAIAKIEAEKAAKEAEEKAKFEAETKAKQDEIAMALQKKKVADAAFFKNENVVCCTDKDDYINEAKKLSSGTIDGVNIVGGRFHLELPLDFFNVEGTTAPLDPSKNSMSLEVIDFGNEGKTVLLHLNLSEAGQEATLSWSGKNIMLAAGMDSGNKIVTLLRGRTPCAVLMTQKTENKRLGMLLSKDGAVSSFSRGMLRSEVEKECSSLGLSKFKYTRDSGKYKVYCLYWLDMQKQYDIFGDYHYNMRNDKKWGEFYFDSQDRLMKWFLYM